MSELEHDGSKTYDGVGGATGETRADPSRQAEPAAYTGESA